MRRARLVERDVVLGGVDDVLAHALDAAAVEMDNRAEALEPARDVGAQPFEAVAIDLQREVRHQVVGAHRAPSSRVTSSSRRSSSTPRLTASSSPAQYSTSSRPSLTKSSVSRRPASPES